MTGSTISSTSAAITSPPASIEPPGPKPSRPGPRSPAWLLGYRRSRDRPSCALSRPEPIKLTVPPGDHCPGVQIDGVFGLVGQVGRAVLHARDPRLGIGARHPLLIRQSLARTLPV